MLGYPSVSPMFFIPLSHSGAQSMSPTLEAIKAKQAELAAMIAAFERQPDFPITIPFPKLNEGEKFIGAILSADGSKRHALILLPGDQADLTWQQAMDWAASIGGELPDRTESALLFATMKGEFNETWYWTRERHASDASYAWCQLFGDGLQITTRIDNQCLARAVRRLPI